jgi:hypothetical protein
MIGNKENDLNLFDFQNSFSTENDCLELDWLQAFRQRI